MIILLPKKVVCSISTARAEHQPRETGGFLIGLRRGSHIEVTGLTFQSKRDISTPRSFVRADPSHRQQILHSWRESAETETIVGDWHSHPNGYEEPSTVDSRAWRKLYISCGKPVLGLIDAGRSSPSLYFASQDSTSPIAKLSVYEECTKYLAFARES